MNQDILIQLLQDKDFFNKITLEFPGLYSACLIIKQNTSSIGRDKSIEKILNFYKTNENFKLFIDSLLEKKLIFQSEKIVEKNDVTGMIIILDKKEESFKKLMQTAKEEKWCYKGIAIVDQFDSIRLYFY